jgi:hypothetical protein
MASSIMAAWAKAYGQLTAAMSLILKQGNL